MIFEIAAVMFAVGMLLGLLGAGGSGFIISILTVGFGFPIHTAFGTAMIAMIFSSISGTVSHYREGNIHLRTGLAVGGIGAAAAWFGSFVSQGIPGNELKWMTAVMLFLSGLALWLRMIMVARKAQSDAGAHSQARVRTWTGSSAVGVVSGGLSGIFGIGSTPFIQLGLMTVLGMPLRQTAGTTMLVIIPIALGGGMGYYHLGFIDKRLLLAVAGSMMVGSYLGAKFTRRVPAIVLKTGVVLFPMIGGAILLL